MLCSSWHHLLSLSIGQVPLDLGKDMYMLQFEGFLKAVRTGNTSDLRCPYHSAAGTYQATQWITEVRPVMPLRVHLPDAKHQRPPFSACQFRLVHLGCDGTAESNTMMLLLTRIIALFKHCMTSRHGKS